MFFAYSKETMHQTSSTYARIFSPFAQKTFLLLASLFVLSNCSNDSTNLDSKYDSDVIKGTFEIVIKENIENGFSEESYSIVDTKTSKRTIVSPKQFPKLLSYQPGSLLQLNGQHASGDQAFEISSMKMLQSSPALKQSTNSLLSTSDIRSMLIVTIDFVDSTFPYSTSEVKTMFDRFNTVYQNTTYGRTLFDLDLANDGTPDIHHVSIAINKNANCDGYAFDGWGDLAMAKLPQINESDYDHVQFMLPNSADCAWAGVAFINGKRSWNRTILTNIFTGNEGLVPNPHMTSLHEVGHNLGMGHAGWDSNGDGIVESYNDHSSFMGNPYAHDAQLNSIHVEQLMGSDLLSQQLKVVSFGTHVVEAIENDPSSIQYPQILKVATTQGFYYYLSYKQPLLSDSQLSPSLTSGLSIHKKHGLSNSNQTARLDVLSNGGVFADAVNKVYIRQQSSSTNPRRVTIEVSNNPNFDPTPPNNVAPIANAQSITSNYETAANFTFSYTDSDGPSPYTFQIVQNPSNGTLTKLSGNNWRYQPDPGFSGSDSIFWKVNDSKDDSNQAKLSITVTAPLPNQLPSVSINASQSYQGDSNVSYQVSASDPDGSIASCRLEFGDGTSVNSCNSSSHAFTQGMYQSCIYVTDNDGGQSSACQNVSIYGEPKVEIYLESTEIPEQASITFNCFQEGSNASTTLPVMCDINIGNQSSVNLAEHVFYVSREENEPLLVQLQNFPEIQANLEWSVAQEVFQHSSATHPENIILHAPSFSNFSGTLSEYTNTSQNLSASNDNYGPISSTWNLGCVTSSTDHPSQSAQGLTFLLLLLYLAGIRMRTKEK